MIHLRGAGMRLKIREVLIFISYLGHVISSIGLKPAPSKVSAILNVLAPKDVSELKIIITWVSELL